MNLFKNSFRTLGTLMACQKKGLLYTLIAGLCLVLSPSLFAQAPSSKIPDLQYFKITYPVNSSGQDNRNVSYNNRSSNYVKAAETTNLSGYTPNSTYRPYFFVSGNDVVFKAHCAGALTSANAYPRCELREKVNGGDDLWRFSDEHELNATFRVTNLPNEKQEVCMLQIKGNSSNSTSSTEEAFRLEYRADGSSGVHLTINEDETRNDVMDYSVGQTMVARMYVNNGNITITLNNLNVSGSRGQYSTTYSSDYSWGYFKAGCYTQSSIWGEKTGKPDEQNNAYGEVRFSALTLGSNSGPTCTANVPGNRSTGNVGTSSATVSWSSVPNIDHYKVRHRKTGTSSWTTSPSIRNTTSYTISGLSNNTTYQWQVRSKCADNSGSSYGSGAGPNFTTGNNSSGTAVVTMRKRNSSGYALDGQGGGANGQNLYLWNFSSTNINQKWVEISRGNGFYSYQKANTNYCIDGGNGGAKGQNVYLWTCGANNQNQHWKKISMGGGAYRLQKRNASGYSIDGMGGGARRQNVHLWTNNNNNQNQHWIFGSSTTREASEPIESTPRIQYYPNPFSSNLTVNIPAGAEGMTSIRISDMMGRVVYVKKGLSPGEKLTISEGISRGMYLLQWMDEKGSPIQTAKVTKQ